MCRNDINQKSQDDDKDTIGIHLLQSNQFDSIVSSIKEELTKPKEIEM
jgi:hypothetical protein